MNTLKSLLFFKILLAISCIIFPLNVSASDSQGGICAEGTAVDCKGDCNGSAGFDSQGNCCLENEQGCDELCYSGKELDICGICAGDGTSCLDCNEVPFGTATFDICNVCDGDGSSCLDCAGIPFGGRTIDECGICGGDGSTCNSCQRTGIRIDRYQPSDNYTFTSDAPACLRTLFDNYYAQCPHRGHPGSCIAIRLINQICGINSSVNSMSNPCYRNYVLNPNTIYFTLSPNCNDLQNSNAQEVAECLGSVVKIVSPISVLLDGSKRLSDDQLIITRFPLEPGKTDQWYSWKASEAAPLLVYDPSQSGKITTAQQLFGNWTFGGKRVAHLGGSDATPVLPAAWENGFEALATLDANGDGEISGKELSPLSLWADSNRNGISEPGEVAPVTSRGISALYFDNVIEDRTGDLYVEKGFKRTIDGRLSTGVLVDWYSSHAASKQSVLLKEMEKAGVSAVDNLLENSVEKLQFEGLSDAANSGENSLGANAFDSVWEWKEKQGDMSGILVFSNIDNAKTVTGFSIVQLNRQIKNGTENLAVAIPFTAEKTIDKDRKGSLSFTVPSGDHVVTKTEAVFSQQYDSLEGKSTIFRGTGQHQQEWHSYEWSAQKIN